MPYTLTKDEIQELWDRYGTGETPASLARRFDKHSTSINTRIRDAGGIRARVPRRGHAHLTADEREEISRGPSAAQSYRQIGIYRSLFIQSRGALNHELTTLLRTRRGVRRPGNPKARGSGKGQLVDTVHISQRPAEAEDRAVPGHWEGDL